MVNSENEENEDKLDYSQPFRVRIIKDCRDEEKEKLDGKYGICLGLYEYPSFLHQMPEGTDRQADENICRYFPLIKVDNEDYLWGTECWWSKESWAKTEPLDKLQSALKKHQEKLTKQMGLEDVLKEILKQR